MKDLIKGKGLVLVTGKKGSGKSHFVTRQINEIVKNYPDHTVYADIDGLNIDNVFSSPLDWQDAENNSTIVYDEAQRLSWCDNSSSKINSDPRVREMTMIRHQNKNIVLITQDPMFIHSALRKLVDVHYHFSHPFKDGKPKCFVFHGAMDNIDAKGVYQSHAIESFIYELDKDTAKLYKSVDDDAKHDQKRVFPKRIKYMIAFIVFLVLVLIPLGFFGMKIVGSFIFGAKDRAEKEMAEIKENQANPKSDNVVVNGVSSTLNQANPIDDKAKREHFEKTIDYVKYNVNKPYEPIDYTGYYRIKDVPILSGCAIFNNKCTCYSQQMTRLDMSTKDCKRYMAGDKPFNPFIEPKSMNFAQESNSRYDSGDNVKNEPKTQIRAYSMTNTSDNAFVKDAVQ